MQRMKFSLASLKDLDFGKADAEFGHHVKIAVLDAIDRPHEERKRPVSLHVDVSPADPSDPDCDKCHVTLSVTGKIPDKRTMAYVMSTTKDGSLAFNPDVPDNPNQRTLMDDIDEKGTDE